MEPSAALPDNLAAAHAEIQQLRAALAEQQMLARIPVQNPNPIYRLGPNEERLFANPAADKLAAELPLEDQAAARETVYGWVRQALLSGLEARHELRIGQRYFNTCVVPFPAEQYVNLYLVEVTERVQAQQELASQQAFTRQVLDTAPILVYVRDAAGNYLFQNQATRDLGEWLSSVTPTPELAAEQAQQMAAYDAADAQVLQTGQQLIIEDEMTLPNGERRCLHTVKRPLVWQPDGAAHVLGVSTDVTDLKRATEAATAAARARENFLANMSHEIRTPLNGVLGIAAQLAKTQLDRQQRELLGIIRSSGQHLLGVINDVLDMAKINSGKLELAQEPFNICETMFQAAQPLILQAQEKGITFEGTRLHESCPYPWVIGDAHRINQITLNLLSNAVKFTPPGGRIVAGGYLLAETDETLTIEFRFQDSGVGIAPDKLARIFDSFTQAYADTARNFGGTGLGLSISRALAEQMGGHLTVESELGKGSTFAFTVTLPRSLAVAPPPENAASTYDTGQLRGKRMLLVEDNEINRVVARLLLEEWGVALDEAHDGPAGLAQAARQRYDVVLMDIQMPGMSGLEVTSAIRALPEPRLANVPILALTANAFQSDTEQYLAAGMNDCVAKPFDEAELYGKLAALLAPPAYDLTALRQMARGRTEFVHRILRSFLTNVPPTLAELQQAVEADNWPELGRLAHHLKPNLNTLGIREATPLVAELEVLGRPDAPPINTARVRSTAAALAQLVQRVLASLPAELAAPVA
ncbi:response regulator [Hymenobacter gummosus]|uniref:Sensory/regulatory protein RpfC n=1 Tax=Hymenobacter gummosus TaxID=1776032 RepID=A0A431TYW0_9BACT|nr:ATP-binding protein [Hymenobacter gummosus]RTQ47530.1 response regulator [Hymenobacter gummosus]